MASEPKDRKDLVVLTADLNTENTVKGLLSRPPALGIRAVRHDIFRHPDKDPGCLRRAPEFLRVLRDQYRHALVLLDREGCGREEQSRTGLEQDLSQRLAVDWGERAAAVVLDPELEIWVWSDSPHVVTILGWQDRQPDLRAWLVDEGFATESSAKPHRPKEAVEKALRLAYKPRSSALYRQLAEKVSFQRCEDPAFLRFKEVLQRWFPPEP
jgi:hypothetical protein